jgi:hypothetical protein
MTTHSSNRRRFLMQTWGGVVLVTSPLVASPGRDLSPAAGTGPAAGDSPLPRGLSPATSHLHSRSGRPGQTIQDRPPALAADLVREFVQKAHADLAATKAMLSEQPSLLNATWDWGGGDFEAAIGGAGHMGNREIAEFLIAQGARFDVFVAAMLGRLDIVRAQLTAWPHLVQANGPHGISLLRHARAGGAPAAAVVEYLLSKGAA